MADQTDNTDIDQDIDAERIEADARRQGWRPEDEYRGKADTWVDAETFIERGKEIKNFTKRENEALRRELATAQATLQEQGKTIEEIREYHAGMEKRAIESAITRLRAERKQAVASGDMALAAELDEDIEELRTAPSAVPAKKDTETSATGKEGPPGGDNVMPKEVKQWHADNSSWYNDDPENEDLVAYADGLSKRLGARRDLSLDEKLEELTARTKKAFPDRFGSAKRVAVTAGAGEGGGREGSRRSSKSVSALPAEARAAGERFVKQKLYKDLEAYAVEYFAQTGVR